MRSNPDKKPVIVIGVPCYGTVAPEILEDWMRFAFYCGRQMPEFYFHIAIRTKSEQFRARNGIIEAALQYNADWLLMLDDDMVVNPFVTVGETDDYGLIRKLMAHDKDICGALYWQRGGECAPILMTKVSETGYRFLRDDEITHGLQKVDVAGGGCLLIKMRVFDRLQHPYFEPEYQFGTDIQLCRKAHEKGFEVWADTSIELGHLKQERAIVTSRNRQEHRLTDTVSGESKRRVVTADVFNRVLEDGQRYTGLTVPELGKTGTAFLNDRADSGLTDADWYQQFPKERVARQLWFNTQMPEKRRMTEFILASIDNHRQLDILEFGCGIGIPAFTLAEKGHRVTACDIAGTGTLEFLKWRAKQHGVALTYHESRGGVPALGGTRYDAIIAMDCLEHLADWRLALRELAGHLKPNGVLFCNNGILDDTTHPEHYPLDSRDFVHACLAADLMPFNQIAYVKRPVPAQKATPELTHA